MSRNNPTKKRSQQASQQANSKGLKAVPPKRRNLPEDHITPSVEEDGDEGQFLEGSFFRGPIPPPEILQGYDNISPGFAERVIAMSEREQKARIAQNDKLIDSHDKRHRRDSWNFRLSWIPALLSLAGLFYLCKYLIDHDSPQTAGWVLVAVTVSLVGVFVVRRVVFPSKSGD